MQTTKLNRFDDYLYETKISFDTDTKQFLYRIDQTIKDVIIQNGINIDNILINYNFNNNVVEFDIYIEDQDRINNISECLDKLNSIKCNAIQSYQAFFTLV